MSVILSDDEVSDNESSSDEDGNFIAFITTVVVDENVAIEENPFDGKLFKDADLQKVYNNCAKLLQRML